MITATKPFLPPLEQYQEKIAQIYENHWLTNHGPMVTELEQKLKNLLDVPYLVLVTNGTIALQIALKALEIQGEVITTPYSYVATTSSLLWENCTPRFADIDPLTFNLDPKQVDQMITPKTKAILATNVYGYPCDFEKFEELSKKYDIPVIYDNAHGFGSLYKGISTSNFGTISSLSFHATKLFHTVEGGALICRDEAIYKKILLLRNFGHTSPNSFASVGINGKMNEPCAAMGLVNLDFLKPIMDRRKEQWLLYYNQMKDWGLQLMEYDFSETSFNFAYFPVVFESEKKLLEVMAHLENNGISTRRYFNPSLNKLEFLPYNDSCPVSEDISLRVLCLPMYHDLTLEEQKLIITKIKEKC